MKKLAIIIAISVLLCSCGEENYEEAKPKSEPPPRQNTDHIGRDDAYALTVTDGKRSVSLTVEEFGECVRATVTEPEELSGVEIIKDVSGLRLFPGSAELSLSTEAAVGYAVFLNAMERDVSKDSYSDGAFTYTDGEYEVKLKLDKDGAVSEIEATHNGYTRHCKVSMN